MLRLVCSLCLLYEAEHVVYSKFADADERGRTEPKKKKNEVDGQKTKTMISEWLKLSLELRETVEAGDDSLWVHHFFHITHSQLIHC